MSEDKKPSLGLFVKSKGAASTSSAPSAAANAMGKPKDVRKRWVYVGMAAVGVVVLASTIFGEDKKLPPAAPKKNVADATIAVDPPKADKAQFEAQFAKDVERLNARVEQLDSQLQSKDKELQDLRNKKNGLGVDPAASANPYAPPTANNTGGIGATPQIAPPAPPVPPTPTVKLVPPKVVPPSPADAEPLDAPAVRAASSSPMVFDAPGAANDSADAQPASNKKMADVQAKVQYKKNTNAGALPAGTFASVALLNGLDAGTSAATQSSPMPVLMNVTDNATLPGSAKYRLKSCFVLGTGYGDLSAERVYVRFSRLSCVDRADRLVLSQEVAGYVVDSDGKLGLRGKVVNRQGAKLGNALLAGFAQGLAGALGQAQGAVSSNLLTGTTTSSVSGGAALRASGLSGAQVAASQLAEFYLKEAQSIFPVISVNTGRTATIVFSNSASLNWTTPDTQFVQEVKPN